MNVMITGASSGIGEAIAKECAKRGDVLFMSGRNRERLESAMNECRRLGASAAHGETIDVADETAMREWIQRCDAIAPIERVFSNAGVSTGEENEVNARRAFATNIGGCINTVLPTIECFRKNPSGRQRRQIVITASIAGYGPLKACPAYSATKACVKTWGLAMRGMLAPEGIEVSVVCPGFVRSRITEKNTCPMPFFMEAPEASKIILSRADAGIGLIAFPWPMRFATWLLSCLPFRINELINRLLPKKVI